MTPSERLNVIALVSGGKDSFFSLLHCLANGHRVVALANLHPPPLPRAAAADATTAPLRPQDGGGGGPGDTGGASAVGEGRVDEAEEEEKEDLNSFMYQTVGHEVVPLYAAATGIPLFRAVIRGGMGRGRREYAIPRELGPSSTARVGTSDDVAAATAGQGAPGQMQEGGEVEEKRRGSHQIGGEGGGGGGNGGEDEDETESMVPLLREVMRAHPEANAVSAGAILSTYQRTRVESVAVRLGLVPLAFLWQFPVLPPAATASPGTYNSSGGGGGSGGSSVGGVETDAQLLDDLHAAGVEARIIKVASGGLDERFLWADVGRPDTVAKLEKAMARFGRAERGAVLGEGGEFETLVVDGPRRLFRKRIVVEDRHRRVVREGGGSAWVHVLEARLENKEQENEEEQEEDHHPLQVRIPSLWDPRFAWVLARLSARTEEEDVDEQKKTDVPLLSSSSSSYIWGPFQSVGPVKAVPSFQPPLRCIVATPSSRTSIQDEAHSIASRVRSLLADLALPPTAITSTIVILRRMDDFPTINPIYGALFPDPNPPSRVTISCGDALPPGINMAVFLALYPCARLGHDDDADADAAGIRRGLHVQSRSYWAPANIGPYSQAVTVPALADSSGASAGGPRIVAIAGQIPLVPASMALPAADDEGGFAMQVALALQHLWRVGAAMDVQWWCSAVAYLPRCEGDAAAAAHAALLAARAWRAAHSWRRRDVDDEGEEEEEADDATGGGPDLWDRRNDAAYRTYGDDEAVELSPPDWDVLERPTGAVDAAAWRPIPPAVFTAEIESLPRAAAVEWHAHAGIGDIPAAAGTRIRCGDPVPVVLSTSNGPDVNAEVRWTVLREGTTDRGWAHCVMALRPLADGSRIATTGLDLGSIATTALEPLRKWGVEQLLDDTAQLVSPDLVYADLEAFAEVGGAGNDVSWLDVTKSAVIPCWRLWDARGERLAAVLLFRLEMKG